MRRPIVLLFGLIFLVTAFALLRAQSPQDWQNRFEKRVVGADRVTIRQIGTGPSGVNAGDISVADPEKVSNLVDLIDLSTSRRADPCKCTGDIALRFFAGRQELHEVRLAHGDRIMWGRGSGIQRAYLSNECRMAIRHWLTENAPGISSFMDGSIPANP